MHQLLNGAKELWVLYYSNNQWVTKDLGEEEALKNLNSE